MPFGFARTIWTPFLAVTWQSITHFAASFYIIWHRWILLCLLCLENVEALLKSQQVLLTRNIKEPHVDCAWVAFR